MLVFGRPQPPAVGRGADSWPELHPTNEQQREIYRWLREPVFEAWAAKNAALVAKGKPALGDPELKCWMPGVPRTMYMPYPFQIVQTPETILLTHEFNGTTRLVRMDWPEETPVDNTYPYGIRLDSKGTPWYVYFRGPRIGSVDPKTMEIKEYPLPNADARPRRLTITSDDVIWYTDFPRGMLGRFDPKTGQVKEWLSPSGKQSEPYAITQIRDVIWYSESGVRPNTMVRFDPKTERFQTFAIPSGGGVLRLLPADAGSRRVGAHHEYEGVGRFDGRLHLPEPLGGGRDPLPVHPEPAAPVDQGVVEPTDEVLVLSGVGDEDVGQWSTHVAAVGLAAATVRTGSLIPCRRRSRASIDWNRGSSRRESKSGSVSAAFSTEGVDVASAEIVVNTTITREGRRRSGKVVGVDTTYFRLTNEQLSEGSYFSPSQIERGRPVAIIGHGVRTRFFTTQEPIGQAIKVQRLIAAERRGRQQRAENESVDAEHDAEDAVARETGQQAAEKQDDRCRRLERHGKHVWRL